MGRTACLAALALSIALAARAEERPVTPVPVLKAAPKVDGDLSDLRGALELPPVGGGTALKARVGVQGASVFLGVVVDDDSVGPGDLLDVSLFFPAAGPAAHGFTFRIAFDGPRAFDEEAAAPGWAQRMLVAQARRTGRGLEVEAQLPARALPAFPVKGPLAFDLCFTYLDRDAVGAPGRPVQSCQGGSMGKTALALPEAFRAALKLPKAPPGVMALEGRAGGWVGYGARHELLWVRGDEALTEPSLAAMVTDAPLRPESIGMAPPKLVLEAAGRKPIFSILSGKDPQPGDVPCDASKEVRLSLYLVEGKAAALVLEGPAVTCALGRATAVVLEEDGALSIGYSSGVIETYSWSTDHFERTEYGMLP
ncbi:MAG TPA: hypothetical protein VFA20_05060 [Myxococcaceae bacterium]|nr:hypothetical protein [Myxococcaceae bacterium]